MTDMLNLRLTALHAAVAIIPFFFAAPSGASMHHEHPHLETMVEDSDLVFRGVVQEIEYVHSEPAGPDGVRLPHTFVTYSVSDVFRGQTDGATVTLRFIGGVTSGGAHMMSSSIVPLFDVGDEDLLLVRGNGHRLSPLVRSDEGRIRIINGRCYTELGQSITVSEDGILRFGRHHGFNEVLTHEVDGVVQHRVPGKRRSEQRTTASHVETIVERILDAGEVVQPAARFESADPLVPFEGPDMTPAPPPADPADSSPSPQH